MVNGLSRLVIWAHSECRSTSALYRAVAKRAAGEGVETTFCLWGKTPLPAARRMELPGVIRVGDDLAAGRAVLKTRGGPGSVQVFCVYQNSSAWRRLVVEAKRGGARVVVYAESPCEMCLGWKAALKRLYYRFVLPWKVRAAVTAADLFISESGEQGFDRLVRLGWRPERIVPFGYASPALGAREKVRAPRRQDAPLRILHLGSEAPYRGVATAVRAVEGLNRSGVAVELVRTGGGLDGEALRREIRAADAVVACGLCEPWGMRVNDVLAEGVPVVTSDGMGARMLCDRYGCGLVFRAGDAADLARKLRRLAEEDGLLARLAEGAETAATAFDPEVASARWLDAVLARGGFAALGVRRILHVSAGWQPDNGAAVVARKLAAEQTAAGAEVRCGTWFPRAELARADEVWIHCGWLPPLWWAASCATRAVWMPHGCYDPVRLGYHGWKKRLAGPLERRSLRRAAKLVATCAAEADWIRAYLGPDAPPIEVTDLKRFFPPAPPCARSAEGPLRVLYLGRRHPLKGVETLERAVAELRLEGSAIELKVASRMFGEEKERAWAWCDVLCLPTLSENFGIVVAEALERGKRVVVTDGAPAWSELDPACGTFVTGYRAASDAERTELIKGALARLS